jgi:hypothetical protein
MASAISVLFLKFHFCSARNGGKKLAYTKPYMGGGNLKGLLTALLSPPQCHAILNVVPHTLASVNHSPVHHPKTLLPL